jgi:uncharacterized protein (DUF1800 family)
MKSLRALALLVLAPLASLWSQTSSISNLSTRAQVGTGGNILITGFNIGPGAPKTILIRATGPALADFGVTGALTDPRLELYSGATKVAENDNWSSPVGTATPVTAAAFSSVGAFGLTAGSRDAALVATLAPGSYTAQVSGTGNGTGVALIEVYEVGALNARLANISARAVVGTGGNILIPGLVIAPGAGNRRLLVRAAGPALTDLGVTGALTDPTMVVLRSSGATLATNDNWGTPVGTGASSAAALTAAFAQNGAFAFATSSRDSALIADFSPDSYTIQVSGVNNTTGVALVEVYDLTPATPATISLRATQSEASETGGAPGQFVFSRTGDLFQSLTVNYAISGTATNGLDYAALPAAITIPAGATSATVTIQPLVDTTVEATESVTLTLAAGTGYTLGADTTGTVSIADTPGSLFVATLRPAPGVTGSTASGLATIILSSGGDLATVSVSFSNLSSGQAGAHLFLGDSTSAGDYVLNLPLGQAAGVPWIIRGTATYTAAQILDALRSGRIYLGVDSATNPAGEIRGAFVSATGSQGFTAPAAPPTVALTNLTATDAARLLTQATFGPTRAEINALTGGSAEAWITQQLAETPTLHLPLERAEYQAVLADARAAGQSDAQIAQIQNSLGFRRRAWYQAVLPARDQLRQRVAFALSQILVVGDDPFGNGHTEGITNYYDLLVTHAFGNYRTLLEQVSRNPIMGIYLSSLRNAKANPAVGTFPDENYAREVMQLFSIGLIMLQPDGTLKLGTDGLPIPTYDNTTITEMAKVFTGWGFFSTATNPSFRGARADYLNPMMMYQAEHDTGQKRLVNGVVLPAGQTGAKDLADALDALFNHPNCAPFVSRRLIQRLVTDNPSPAYVYRVAQVFDRERANPNQLGAVVRALLTDYEARSPAVAATPGFGKLREPLLRFTALLRSFNATSSSGRNRLESSPYANLLQGPLESPTVFNFFEPDYVHPGALAAAGLVAPTFQITNDTTAISTPNFLRSTVFTTAAGSAGPFNLVLDLAPEQALVPNVPGLLDHLSLIMTGNQLSAATRTRLTTALGALTATTSARERAQSAILLLATSVDGAIQK